MVLLSLAFTGALMAEELLLDDFSDGNGVSAIGTEWQGFTDRVMGGRSDMETRLLQENDTFFLRMQGSVSLEDNGGFIQVRLMLGEGRGRFDASEYNGIRIKYRTTLEGSYYLHIRTSQNRFPWAHFAAPLPNSPEWGEARIPWSAFEGQLTPFNTPRLDKMTSIAVVAAKEEFSARIDVREIGLY